MNIKYLFIAVAAAMLTACSSDESTDNWAGEIRLSSSLSVQETTTRATTDVQSTVFESGESIGVYIEENTTGTASATYDQPLKYTTGSSGALTPPTGKHPYFPSSGNGVNIYAVYPYIAAINSSFTIDTYQVVDDFYKESDLMYGTPANNATVERTSSTVPLTFKHLLSKVTIKLVSGNGHPMVDGATVQLLNVKPTISYTFNYSGYSLGTASGNTTSITVMRDSGSEGSAVIIPQTLSDIQFIKVTLPATGTLYGSLDGATTGPTFESGNEYIYTITVNLTSLSISSTISPWTTSDANDESGTATMQ